MLVGPDHNAAAKGLIGPKDTVIAVLGPDSMKAVNVDDEKFSNVAGNYCPKDWVGQPYGCCVYPTKGYNVIHRVRPMYILAPSPELWTRVLKHRTQILYLPDISLVCAYLELRPGCVVLESGTGSGSMSHSLARAVHPSGHLYTFEYHEERSKIAGEEFKNNGMGSVVSVFHRDIEGNGFPEAFHGKADALFLDLPGPWKAVASAAKCLKGGGRFCSFSPCIEQIQKTADELQKNAFTSLRTMECLSREHSVKSDNLIVDLEAYQREQELLRAKRIASKKRVRQAVAKADDAGDTEAMDLETVKEDPAEKQKDPVDEVANVEPPCVPDNSDAPQGAQAEESVGPSIVLPRVASMKGHTGYLLFARKFMGAS